MKFKLDNDYETVLHKVVREKKLADEITRNLDFVERYLDKVNESFENETDKSIAYKQLGIIAFSCVEALWKGIIMTINGNCSSRDCHKKCEYRQYTTDEEINRLSPDRALKHINNMRIISILPFELEGIEDLQHLRNHVHLTRAAIDSDQANKFDTKFVEGMLRLYYVTFDQIAMLSDFYFNKESPCLYELDEHGYEETKNWTIKEIQNYNTYKIVNYCMNFIHNKFLANEDAIRLKKLKNEKNINVDEFVRYLGRLLYYEGAHYKTEAEFNNALEKLFNILRPYLANNSIIIERIKEQIQKFKADYYS